MRTKQVKSKKEDEHTLNFEWTFQEEKEDNSYESEYRSLLVEAYSVRSKEFFPMTNFLEDIL